MPGDPPFCPFHSRSSIGVRSLTSAVPTGFIVDATARLLSAGVPAFDIFTEVFVSPVEIPSRLEAADDHLEQKRLSLSLGSRSGNSADRGGCGGHSPSERLPHGTMRELQR